MESENINVPSEQEEPEVFSVIIDGRLAHFNRREFLGKAAAASAAVTLLASGCSPTPVPVAATMEVPAAVPTKAPVEEPTEAPTSTATEVPTNTPTKKPTSTKKPTATPTATPITLESYITGETVNFRSGPSTGYPPITQLSTGDAILLTGRLEDSSWVAVALADPNQPGSFVNGWIKTVLVNTSGIDITILPVITDIPPTPTPLPGVVGRTGAGKTGIDYTIKDIYGNVYTMTLPCGSPLPDGATCTCDCITVPAGCSCVEHTASTCTCDTIHYWYPN